MTDNINTNSINYVDEAPKKINKKVKLRIPKQDIALKNEKSLNNQLSNHLDHKQTANSNKKLKEKNISQPKKHNANSLTKIKNVNNLDDHTIENYHNLIETQEIKENIISVEDLKSTNDILQKKIISNASSGQLENHNNYNLDDINNASNNIVLNTNLLYNFGTNIIPKTDLSGHIIVSSPNLLGDSLLSKTLIYIASHTATGAFGFILNNFIGNISWDTIVKNNNEVFKNSFVDMYYGGIEEQGKGFILHSQDHNSNVLFSSNVSKINVSHNNDIIKSIVYEGKPKDYLFLTGCTLWPQGQLEKEMMSNFWVVLDPNLTKHFIFNPVKDEAWSLALNIIGINPNKYITKMGTD